MFLFFFFQAEDGIRDAQESRGLGDVYKRQPKDGGGGGGTSEGGGGGGGRGGDGKYKGFQWYTDGKKARKVDFSKMQQRMHGADEKGNTQDFDDDEEEELASKAKGKGNPAGASEATIQAWFRFITRWAAVFVTLRAVSYTHLTLPTKRIV
eukprot:TRINITY_DN7679_c0_g1_i1.p1 TRINITY_DN7679_c0_g1~~TRINITY_DN7679_c0_g1_i1.p1  ORF type:complete len:151 (+),score=72.13 TRINITY_DN7679_c0_g1_i1:73-525(+)